MNPDSVLLEAWQSILTVDGSATDGFPLSEDPCFTFKGRRVSSRADASIAAHSCIIIDGNRTLGAPTSYTDALDKITTGRLLRHDIEEELQVLTADVTDFYAHSADIESIVRTSAMIDEIRHKFRIDKATDQLWPKPTTAMAANIIAKRVRFRFIALSP